MERGIHGDFWLANYTPLPYKGRRPIWGEILMRFLILTQYYEPEIGAAQVRLGSVARALIELGHEVEVVTTMANYPKGKIAANYRGYFYLREIIHGVTVHRLWVYAAIGLGLKRIANYLSFTMLSFGGLCQCRRPDYVFVESPPLLLAAPGLLAARCWKAKMILNEADFWLHALKELGLIREKLILNLADLIERWAYRQAYRITAVTEGIRQFLIKKGVPESKILFLPNGVDTALIKPLPYDLELAGSLNLVGKKIFLYAGNMGYAHGLDVVLEAAELLGKEKQILFLFIGDGSENDRLKKVARGKSLENVLFLDPAPLEFVVRLYSLALAGLVVLRDIPLNTGARSAKMFTAMAAGVPVLYSGAGEGAGLVETAMAGLVVTPDNPKELAEAVLKLAGDPELAASLGRNGRCYVVKNMGWLTLVSDWLTQLNG
jgi:colanic acid biosynthesis glycosyl transferase WcaI